MLIFAFSDTPHEHCYVTVGSEHIYTRYMLAPGGTLREITIPEYVMLRGAVDAPTSAFDISRNSTTSRLIRPTSVCNISRSLFVVYSVSH